MAWGKCPICNEEFHLNVPNPAEFHKKYNIQPGEPAPVPCLKHLEEWEEKTHKEQLLRTENLRK